MTVRILPVIMSGGSGTRLWPLSNDDRPKQFHALGGERTMIQDTALRFRAPAHGLTFLDPAVIASERHGALVASQLAEIGVTPSAVVLEPMGRNTAATAALAARIGQEIDPEALVLLMPADHVMTDPDGFAAALSRAAPFASSHIVTFGMTPTGPETGFGYIRQGAEMADGVYRIKQFREKPNLATARRYLASGDYSWNSGVFLYGSALMREEFGADHPILVASDASWDRGRKVKGALVLDADTFRDCPNEPVDIAIMEKTKRGAVAPCQAGWADLGSWSEIWSFEPQDEDGNAVRGPATLMDAANCLVMSDGVKLAVAGVKDLVIIAAGDTVMVIPRAQAQAVKQLLAKVKKG